MRDTSDGRRPVQPARRQSKGSGGSLPVCGPSGSTRTFRLRRSRFGWFCPPLATPAKASVCAVVLQEWTTRSSPSSRVVSRRRPRKGAWLTCARQPLAIGRELQTRQRVVVPFARVPEHVVRRAVRLIRRCCLVRRTRPSALPRAHLFRLYCTRLHSQAAHTPAPHSTARIAKQQLAVRVHTRAALRVAACPAESWMCRAEALALAVRKDPANRASTFLFLDLKCPRLKTRLA